jgi:chromosome partitioning related protein ParA
MRTTTVLSVVSTKGGSGKTTTAANIGGLIAALGQRVLLIDADMQPSLSKYYKLYEQPTTGLSQVISRGGVIDASDIVQTTVANLSLLPSNMEDHVQGWLKEREDRLIMLKRAVRQPIVRENFDVVIIDTQGAKGELQRTAAMAADLMISPIRPDMLNFTEFATGTLEMLESLNVMADMMPEMRAAPLAIFVNCVNRTTNAKVIEEHIRSQFRTHPGVRVLDTRVPEATAYQTSRTMQLPVHEIDPPKSKGTSGFEVMHELVFEVLPHLKGLWVNNQIPSKRDHESQGGE